MKVSELLEASALGRLKVDIDKHKPEFADFFEDPTDESAVGKGIRAIAKKYGLTVTLFIRRNKAAIVYSIKLTLTAAAEKALLAKTGAEYGVYSLPDGSPEREEQDAAWVRYAAESNEMKDKFWNELPRHAGVSTKPDVFLKYEGSNTEGEMRFDTGEVEAAAFAAQAGGGILLKDTDKKISLDHIEYHRQYGNEPFHLVYVSGDASQLKKVNKVLKRLSEEGHNGDIALSPANQEKVAELAGITEKTKRYYQNYMDHDNYNKLVPSGVMIRVFKNGQIPKMYKTGKTLKITAEDFLKVFPT